MDSDDLTAAVKCAARAAGFWRVGIAPAARVRHTGGLRRWLARGWHAGMAYMEARLARRVQPDLLVPGAESVVCLAVPYAPPPARPADAPPGELVARYARGRDYHKVLRRRCRDLMDRMRRLQPSLQARAFVDSAPVMERSLAARAGLGWIARNGCLIAPGLGSYVVLAEIVCNLPLRPDGPVEPQCGRCRRCVDACPTGALHADGLVDARVCVSYLTVEHAGRIDRRLWPQMGTALFGCDRCQEACPHNRSLPAGDEALTGAKAPLGGAGLAEVLAWSPQDWDRATRGSAVRRAKRPQLLRNALIAAGNVPPPAGSDLLDALRRLRERAGDLAETADWALDRHAPSPA